MIHINGYADPNDVLHAMKAAKKQGLELVSAQPCPYSDFDPKKAEGKINPHVTKFQLSNGQFISVFHVKPIYYETHKGQWRPMSEVAHGFGNHWIDFKADWHEKMHPRYMQWLIKRAEILKTPDKLKIPTQYWPYGVPITIEKEPVTVT